MTGRIGYITQADLGRASGQDATGVDICLQAAVWADRAKVARRIARVIGGDPDTIEQRLHHPSGLLFESVSMQWADDVATRLAGTRGAIVLRSDPASARYDIHATRPLSPGDIMRLVSLRRLVGAQPDPLTEAVAADIDRPNRDALLQRLPDLGLLAIDRRFQRFDLLLTGVTGWTSVQLADFLVARTQMPRAAFEQVSQGSGLILDLGLKPDVARQFCADYAALGLMVRPVLSPRGRNA